MAGQSPKTETDRRSIIVELDKGLRFLTPEQVSLIDELLDGVKPFGEVKLRVEEGKLTFAAESKSYDALKLQRPNALEEQLNNES